MKLLPVLLFASFCLVPTTFGQGTVIINPVPVTNVLTGTLADSSFVAALYYGPTGAVEDSLLPVLPAAPLVGGQAVFGQTGLPLIAAGASVQLQVRAWSLGYASYESATGSGLPSVLAGKSVGLSTTLGAPSGPPLPATLTFPGFTVMPVPEPTSAVLLLAGMLTLACARRRSR